MEREPGQRSIEELYQKSISQRSLDQKVKRAKFCLKQAIILNVETDKALSAVVEIDLNLQDKLCEVDVSWMKNEPFVCEEDMTHLCEVIKYLRDIGLFVCSHEGTTIQNEAIPAGRDSIFKHGSSLVEGSNFTTKIIRKLGYTEEADGFLNVPASMDTDFEMVAMVTTELMVATEELELYMCRQHPNPDKVAEIIPPVVRTFDMTAISSPIYANVESSVTPSECCQPAVISNEVCDIKIPIQKLRPESAAPVLKPGPKLLPKPSKIATFQNGQQHHLQNEQKTQDVISAASGGTAGTTSIEGHSPSGAISSSVALSTNSATDPLKQTNLQDVPPRECELCGKKRATVSCGTCTSHQYLCDGCNQSWHQHVARRDHQTKPVINAVNILHPKPRVRHKMLKIQAADRSSMVVVHGKIQASWTSGNSDLEENKMPAAGLNKTHQLHKKSLSLSTEQEYGLTYAVPRPPDEKVPLFLGSHDQVEDSEESLPIYNANQTYEDVDTGARCQPVIPTANQEFSLTSQFNSAKLKDDLEKEGVLHNRKVKVTDRLCEVEQRLGNISSGMESTSVLDRIDLMREQEFLKQYKADLDKSILEDTKEQSQTPKSGIKAAIKDFITHLSDRKRSLSSAKLKHTVPFEEQEKEEESVYYEDINKSEKPVPKWQSQSERPRLNHTGVSDLSVTVSSDTYEDVKTRPIIPVPSTLPHALPRPKANVQRTESEPTQSKGSWVKGWLCPWQCEHCTFHMEAGTRVCKLCYKTSDNPVLLSQSNLGQRPLPSTPSQSTPVSPGKSVKTLGVLDNIVAMQKIYAKSSTKTSHGEMLTKLDDILRSNRASITYFNNRQESAMSQKSEQCDLEKNGYYLLAKLKEADKNKFTIEEFHIAYKQETDADPSHWLKTVWLQKVNEVYSKATRELLIIHQSAELSEEEARVALIQTNGEVNDALRKAVSTWIQIYEELLTNLIQGGMPTEKDKDFVVMAMKESHGDLSEASIILFREVQTPRLLDNMWRDEIDIYTNDEVSFMLPGQPGHDKPYEIVTDNSISKEKRRHLLMAEFKLDTVDKANNVLLIWDKHDQLPDSVTIVDIVEAVRNCGTTTRALGYLQQICAACECKFPATKIQMLSFCQCKLCMGCMKEYFSLTIKEKQVRDLVCPMCRKPDISNREQFEQHLQLLLLMLRHHLVQEDVELFEKKLRDWSLMQDPNFRWCSYDDCGCGFIFTCQIPAHLMMICPECARATCYQCKKPWEAEHSGQTCEQFESLKAAKKPEKATAGTAMLLQDAGINCPKCHYRYAIANGGCMHFTCSQCGHEFCSGCKKTFNRSTTCQMLESCSRSGLHCHHPRCCLYYLRNEPVQRLQKLLQGHTISYLTLPPGRQSSKQTKCPVMELKDTDRDEPCGKSILKHHAGLCELHYKEYLVGLINQHTIDPVTIMGVDELKNLFKRVGKDVPSQTSSENLQLYKNRLILLVKQEIPLPVLSRHASVLSAQ